MRFDKQYYPFTNTADKQVRLICEKGDNTIISQRQNHRISPFLLMSAKDSVALCRLMCQRSSEIGESAYKEGDMPKIE